MEAPWGHPRQDAGPEHLQTYADWPLISAPRHNKTLAGKTEKFIPAQGQRDEMQWMTFIPVSAW